MTKRSLVLTCCFLSACAAPAIKPSESHIQAEAEKPASAPSPVTQSVVLPPPKPAAKLETYSVVVTGVPVQELLFALARDAKLNVDIHSGIQGTVTLNAINQTLPQILSRIAKQVDMRYEVDGPNLVVMPDAPFLRNYTIDYVNMARDATSNVAIATQITTPGATGTGGSGGAAAGGGNTSVTSITNTTKNRFWETLIQNIKDLLKETDKILPEGTSETVVQQAETQATTGAGGQPRARAPAPDGIAGSPGPAVLETAGTTVVRRTTFREAASVIANPEAGIIMVRASSRQHEKVQEFLDSIMTNARRQVLIEATIVEVALNQNYQQGIDWQYIRQQGSQSAIGQGATTQRFDPVTGALTAITSTLPSTVANTLFTAAFRNGGFTAAIKLLEAFGTTKVVSSPKLSVLNNQTAMLKVVDNLVYFTIKADTTTNQTTAVTTFTTTPNTVSVGFVMSVTPQIGDDDSVLLNLRPTISRKFGLGIEDPNPDLKKVGVISVIPEIQTREMESLLRVNSGEIAVMGGLMQDEVSNKDDGVPGLAGVPLLGNLFTHRNDATRKTELVIFVRPVVIKEASLDGDYKSFRPLLPGSAFTSVPNPFSKQPARTSQ